MNTKTHHSQIIIVEDDGELRVLLEYYLKTLGFQTIKFPSPIEALKDMRSGSLHEEIKTKSTPIIISDNSMPEMDGSTFHKIVQREFPQIPFILMTAFGSQEDIEAAKKARVFGFVSKPFELSEIREAVFKAQEHLRLSKTCK